MRKNGLAAPAAEALAPREDDHQPWADDGSPAPDTTRPETPTDARMTQDPHGLPVLLVYRRPVA